MQQAAAALQEWTSLARFLCPGWVVGEVGAAGVELQLGGASGALGREGRGMKMQIRTITPRRARKGGMVGAAVLKMRLALLLMSSVIPTAWMR
jgi:hypothetical protein